jgi:hypothetical protein
MMDQSRGSPQRMSFSMAPTRRLPLFDVFMPRITRKYKVEILEYYSKRAWKELLTICWTWVFTFFGYEGRSSYHANITPHAFAHEQQILPQIQL